ncbi:MAG TPA: ABC transporter permease [Cyclobacteriaceae bacterium]|nr:ABC transporter permease [Cyclobacteriaceae bacterium]
MISSYLRTALRNFTRHKAYSFINIFGLSVGIGCCLLLSLYVYHEISYDKHHVAVNDIYRINTVLDDAGNERKMRTCSPPVAMTMMEEVAGIRSAARVLNPPQAGRSLISYNGNSFYESDGLIADSTVFGILTYEFLEGDMSTALTQPNSAVISEQMAGRLFGKQTALDKIISITQGGAPGDFRVTGVFRTQKLSHISANFFTSINSSGWAEFLRSPGTIDEWVGNNFVPSYVRLDAGEDPAAVIEKMNVVLTKYAAAKLQSTGRKKALTLEPVKDIYLKSDVGQSPRIAYVYSVFMVGVFILVIACINFMNLSTARASRRAAEIGIRKVMGAFRASLIRQIMAESMAFVVISAVIGVGFAWLFLPYFNEVTGSFISFSDIHVGYIIVALLSIVLVTGLLAGSYPAFYISSFQPALVLKGKMSEVNAKGWLRRSLVVFQFMVTIVLVCGTIVVSRQMDFVRSMPLGYESSAKLVLPLRTSKARESFDALKQQLLTNRNVNAVGGTDFIPGTRILYDNRVYPFGANLETAVSQQFSPVDPAYMPMMDIKLLSGRHFTPEDAPTDGAPTAKVIINKTSADQLGFPIESAPGRIFSAQRNDTHVDYEVIGVMEDFHQTSLHDKVPPTIFYMQSDSQFQNMVIDLETTGLRETIAAAQAIWSDLVPGTPFEFTFLDDSIQLQYISDQQTAVLINTFSAIAIVISCLGLYALSAFMTERRFREIGIRKVMGASARQIVVMMSSEYVKLVAVSLIVSIPFAWMVLDRWLEGFAYRINMDYSIFIYAGVFAISIALLTVCFETFKAANTNPVKSLKGD